MIQLLLRNQHNRPNHDLTLAIEIALHQSSVSQKGSFIKIFAKILVFLVLKRKLKKENQLDEDI